MCGIAGVWHPVGDLEHSIHAMTDSIRHRGPDADGHFVSRADGLALGHRRLSIVDLSPTGAQPMHSASARYTTVYNGEAYNFRSHRRDLVARGHRFRGTSDTEVLLTAFEEEGIRAAVPRFAGMFAMGVWDAQRRELWLVRDRLGEKPLYYGQFGQTFAFASEIGSLRQLANCPTDIDPLAVADVLERGYIRGTRSIHPGIRKLPPGTMLRVTCGPLGFDIQLERYWSVDAALPSRSPAHRANGGASGETAAHATRDDAAGDALAIESLDRLLSEVIAEEMVADVPVGAFLSGGIDSSLVVAIMQQVAPQPVRTFTIGFGESEFDESAHARSIADHLGTAHTEIRLAASDALRFVDRLPGIFGEPFADSSQLPTLLVCEATRAHVTVALSGDGGDELFGGYSQYHGRDSIGAIVSRVPRFARRAVAAGVSALPDAAFGALGSGTTWPPNVRTRLARTLVASDPVPAHESLLSEWANPFAIMAPQHAGASRAGVAQPSWPDAPSFREAQMAYDMQTYLPDDILVKVDRSAMAVSLETRAPLIDHRVVEFALRQPLARKIRGGTGKFLLREVLSRHVPRALWDRPKQGFAIPLDRWLRTELREWAEAMLVPDALLREWFRPTPLHALWNAHLQGANHAARLWRVLMVMQWLRSRSAA